jgi:hypothetical protein
LNLNALFFEIKEPNSRRDLQNRATVNTDLYGSPVTDYWLPITGYGLPGRYGRVKSHRLSAATMSRARASASDWLNMAAKM